MPEDFTRRIAILQEAAKHLHDQLDDILHQYYRVSKQIHELTLQQNRSRENGKQS